jgi:DNA-directed RNA polymerase specialized sigma24 family protein
MSLPRHALNAWAKGTIAALNRANGPASDTARTDQIIVELRAENEKLQHLLRVARERVRALEAALAASPAPARAGVGDSVHAVNQAEAARILGVHPATVSRWVAAGHFDLVEGPGKHPLIAARSLHRPAPKSRRNRR